MRSPAFPPRRPSAILRYLLPAFFLISLFYYLRPEQRYHASRPIPPASANAPSHEQPPAAIPPTSGDGNAPIHHQSPSGKTGEKPSEYTAKEQHDVNQPRPADQQEPIVDSSSSTSSSKTGAHPIDNLIDTADRQFADILAQESHSLHEAAASYRRRRGRHPPPGFDVWHKFATERNAVMVESFFDQIYHDLEPFWALPANEIRRGAWDYEMTIKVRSGFATAESDWFWTQIWLGLIQTIAPHLPDMDIALNAMDEPRLVVPWEKMDEYMKKASTTRSMAPARDAINAYEKLAQPGQGPDKDVPIPDKNWEGTSKWHTASTGLTKY